MREFIRHPTTIPITFSVRGEEGESEEEMINVSHGGLCFVSAEPLKPRTHITISIPVSIPPFEARGVVAWCSQSDAGYEVGVSFKGAKTEFCVRMVEQICRIEMYRKFVREQEGRALTGRQATLEWIDRHAENFPR